MSVTTPYSFIPWNGVFIPFDSNFVLSTVQVALGSKIVMSAREPGFRVPMSGRLKVFAGLIVIFAIASERVSTFVFTRFVIMSDNIVSNPTIPAGAD